MSTEKKQTATVSYKEIRTFLLASNNYITNFKEETKLKYAIDKMATRLKPIHDEFYKKVGDIEVENAAEKEGIVQFINNKEGQREYQFTKEGLKKRDKEVEELFNSKNILVETYHATSLPEDLHESWFEVFVPFVVKEKPESKNPNKYPEE